MTEISYRSLISAIQSYNDFDTLDSNFPDISSIFKRPRYDYTNENAKKRFARSKELFGLSAQNGERRLPAFFYRLKYRIALEGDYVERLGVIKNQFMSYLRADVTTNNIVRAFHETLELASIANQQFTPALYGKLAEKRTIDIIWFLFNQYLSERNVDLFNGKWFDAQITNVKHLAARVFYQVQPNINYAPSFFANVVDNIDMAINQGQIYSPTANFHNWGLNVCWVLGIIVNKIPIKIMSPLNEANLRRSDYYEFDPLNELQPSAFALEIAVAMEAGYEFQIRDNDNYLYPTDLTNRIFDDENQNICIPSIERQIELYRQLMSNIRQHVPQQKLRVAPGISG